MALLSLLLLLLLPLLLLLSLLSLLSLLLSSLFIFPTAAQQGNSTTRLTFEATARNQ